MVEDRRSEGKELSVWWREFLLTEAEGEGGGILRLAGSSVRRLVNLSSLLNFLNQI